jgi:hypothetical protein
MEKDGFFMARKGRYGIWMGREGGFFWVRR